MDSTSPVKLGRPPLSSPLQLYINGQCVSSKGGTTFPVHNPLTGQKLYECASAGPQDYVTAIVHAHKAYKAWSQMGPSARRQIFLRAADILETYLDDNAGGDAAEILSNEVSAVLSWVTLNVKAAAAILRETAGLVTHIKGEIVPADRPGTTIMITREACGVVFAISPWNSPATRAVATPLICGNSVIFKPSEVSPKSQFLLIRALIEAGLPAGCVNFLPSRPADAAAVTELTVKHRLVRRINFTGGDKVGKIIAGWAASCLKQCLLELGGKAPVIVLKDAALEDAVEAVVFGALTNSGQICMSTERIIVDESIADKFNELLLQRVSRIKIGNHLEDHSVSLSGLHSPGLASRVLSLVDEAVSAGACLIAGDRTSTGPRKTIVQAHVLDKVTPEMGIFHEETFGPVICVTHVSSIDEAIDVANNSEYSLCASVFTRDVMAGLDVAKQVKSGSCHVNAPTVFIEPTLPNGGVGGRSGYGRFGGTAGIHEFTDQKITSLVVPGMKYPI
ncbi:uncharacterized protein Z518_02635 [Rhinocladiella mackenziei CBS 650.93]|uniref:Aldehyde dehydrogenase domain-containing protein n=1 Tax=Rhinocladiella mackenziei CBS 650.93 TaxID=1442369 RepID=A0A0D2IXC9_9EURO|nr:uncharacterized protein Z518_02635 [Rhinocladiella mackenziei CBS 650.93]KIX07981.1 hypothetical protein Z518_02635 [Rhinocladiella mackenziei CBS 650.93]